VIANRFLPESEYQIGNTLIFLREGCFDILQSAMRAVLHKKAAKIQALVRAHLGTLRFSALIRQVKKVQSILRFASDLDLDLVSLVSLGFRNLLSLCMKNVLCIIQEK
jgi:myosin heavy subunit